MSIRLILPVCLVVCGCLSSGEKELALDEDYRPLKAVKERGTALDVVIHSDSAITTIGEYSYVESIDKFIQRRPPGSITFRAIMLHEREHAVRQLEHGTFWWVTRYSYDRDFALNEEKRGYYYEIKTLINNGVNVSPEGVAQQLSSYKNVAGRLVSFEDALVWARNVINGTWTPNDVR